MRTAQDKIVHDATSQIFRWFDLVGDPREDAPMRLGDDERSRGLLSLYGEVQAELRGGVEGRPGQVERPEIPATVQRSLQANGYVGDGADEER